MPPLSADQRAVFAAGLRAERDAFLEFCDLLQTERACLLRSDIEALLDVTRRKSEQVDRLVNLGNARIAYLEARGIEPGSSDIERWLADHAGVPGIDTGASGVSQLWRELTEIARNARAMNEANGKLITARLTHNQGALSALQAGARPNALYGPDGQANVPTRNRELGRA